MTPTYIMAQQQMQMKAAQQLVERKECDHFEKGLTLKTILDELNDITMLSLPLKAFTKRDYCRLATWIKQQQFNTEYKGYNKKIDEMQRLEGELLAVQQANTELVQQLEMTRFNLEVCNAKLEKLSHAEQVVQEQRPCSVKEAEHYAVLLDAIATLKQDIIAKLPALLTPDKNKVKNARILKKLQTDNEKYGQIMAEMKALTQQQRGNCTPKNLVQIDRSIKNYQFKLAEINDAYSDAYGGVARVYLRMKPGLGKDDVNNLYLTRKESTFTINCGAKPATYNLGFSNVFTNRDTNSTVNAEILPLILRAPDVGYNLMLMAYGQSGSGKSHTLLHPSGLLYSAVELLLKDYPVLEISAVQYYKKHNYDIFKMATFEGVKNNRRFKITWTPKKNWSDVDNEDFPTVKPEIGQQYMRESVRTLDDLSDIMETIAVNRFTRATRMNPESSRSHVFINIYVNGAVITFVDLAGNEKFKAAAGPVSEAAKEGESIVKSLNDLKTVFIDYLKQGTVDTRDSKYKSAGTPDFLSLLNGIMRFDDTSVNKPINKLCLILTTATYFMKKSAESEIYNNLMCDTGIETFNFAKGLLGGTKI
jgi:hypothetical protein